MSKWIVKEMLGLFLRYSGLAPLIRFLRARSGVSVVVYHDPAPETFERHMAFLSKRYSFISMDTLADALASGDWSRIPPYALVVTLDDGHRGNYALLDVIRRYDVFPTLYLCSGIVDTHRRFWWKTPTVNIEALKNEPHAVFLEQLQEEAAFRPEKEYPDRQALNRDELLEMQPHVCFGAHTRFHPILTRCDDETCRGEMVASKDELEALLGQEIKHFAYTNGDYGERERGHARDFGFQSARGLDVGWNTKARDRFSLKVTGVQDDASLNVLGAQLCGVFGAIRRLKGTS